MTPKKVFYGMIAALVVVVAAGFGAFYFVDGQLTSKADQVNSLRADLEILDLKISNSKQAGAEFAKYEDLEKTLDEVLPPEKIQNDIIAEILDIAARNKATLGTISFPSSGESTDFTKSQTTAVEGVNGVLAVEIQIEAIADFDETLSLLEDFEKNQRKMQVVNVTITPEVDDNSNPTGKFILSLRINVYQRA